MESEGELLGFASYGVFRHFPAYKYTAEHSLYVQHTRRRQGLGKALLQELVQRALHQQMHVMVGAIDANNHANIALHEQTGFGHAGTIQQAGFMFGRGWMPIFINCACTHRCSGWRIEH